MSSTHAPAWGRTYSTGRRTFWGVAPTHVSRVGGRTIYHMPQDNTRALQLTPPCRGRTTAEMAQRQIDSRPWRSELRKMLSGCSTSWLQLTPPCGGANGCDNLLDFQIIALQLTPPRGGGRTFKWAEQALYEPLQLTPLREGGEPGGLYPGPW